MAKYMTKQRRLLLDCLSRHADEALSAKQVVSELADEDISPSAVYRNLAALEEEGLVKRISKQSSREVYFQYTDAPECRERLHLSCKRCGKTYHMNSDGAELLIRSVAEKEGFRIDKCDTVLYGICGDCQKI